MIKGLGLQKLEQAECISFVLSPLVAYREWTES